MKTPAPAELIGSMIKDHEFIETLLDTLEEVISSFSKTTSIEEVQDIAESLRGSLREHFSYEENMVLKPLQKLRGRDDVIALSAELIREHVSLAEKLDGLILFLENASLPLSDSDQDTLSDLGISFITRLTTHARREDSELVELLLRG